MTTSPVVTSRQPLQDLPELLPSPGLALLAGQHQVGVEVVRDERGGQVPEIQLQHRTGSRLETLILYASADFDSDESVEKLADIL